MPGADKNMARSRVLGYCSALPRTDWRASYGNQLLHIDMLFEMVGQQLVLLAFESAEFSSAVGR